LSTLTAFFKGSDTQFGIFYPIDYVVAVFPDLPSAVHAEKLLEYSGFCEDDVIAVPGEEMLRTAAEHKNVWDLLMQKLSRTFATEEVYTDHDLKLAKRGAAFVAVYCPTEELKKEAWDTLRTSNVVAARHYATAGVEHLKGEI
jgi:hypothetical protein